MFFRHGLSMVIVTHQYKLKASSRTFFVGPGEKLYGDRLSLSSLCACVHTWTTIGKHRILGGDVGSAASLGNVLLNVMTLVRLPGSGVVGVLFVQPVYLRNLAASWKSVLMFFWLWCLFSLIFLLVLSRIKNLEFCVLIECYQVSLSYAGTWYTLNINIISVLHDVCH